MQRFKCYFIKIYPVVFCALFALIAINYVFAVPKFFTLHGEPKEIFFIVAFALFMEFLIIVNYQSKLLTVTAVINFFLAFFLTVYPFVFFTILTILIVASLKNPAIKKVYQAIGRYIWIAGIPLFFLTISCWVLLTDEYSYTIKKVVFSPDSKHFVIADNTFLRNNIKLYNNYVDLGFVRVASPSIMLYTNPVYEEKDLVWRDNNTLLINDEAYEIK